MGAFQISFNYAYPFTTSETGIDKYYHFFNIPHIFSCYRKTMPN